MRFRGLLQHIWRQITGSESSSSSHSRSNSNEDDNSGRSGRRRRRLVLQSSPIDYQRSEPVYPTNYDSDTSSQPVVFPLTRPIRAPFSSYVIGEEPSPPSPLSPRSPPSPLSSGSPPSPPPYPCQEPPPPYYRPETSISPVSTSESEDGANSESSYGDTIYEYEPSRPLSNLITNTSATSSELERKERYPTSVRAGGPRSGRGV